MPISRVTSQTATGSAGAATLSLTWPATPTQNDLLILALTAGNGTGSIGTPTATGWSQAFGLTFNSAFNSVALLYKHAGAGETTAVAAACSGATALRGQIYEYSGNRPDAAGVLDKTATGSGTAETSQVSGTTATTTQPDELVFLMMGVNADITGASWSNSVALLALSNARLATGEKFVSATGAYASTMSWTTAVGAGGGIATFRGANFGKSANLGQAVNRAGTY